MCFMPEPLPLRVLCGNEEMHPDEGKKVHYIVLVIVTPQRALLLQCKENTSYFQSLLTEPSIQEGT